MDLPDQLIADDILVPKWLPAVQGARAAGWHTAYEGAHSVVLSRSLTPPVVRGVATGSDASSADACFPGP
jgi:hypothetical protein